MWEWLQQNTAVFGALMNALMVFIWIFYLQLFLVGFLRQRRSVIHISRGAAKDEKARCIVTNMGSEPVYLVAVVVDLEAEGKRHRAVVTDRDEIPEEDADNPLQRTNEGPLASGEALDVGSFWELAQRAGRRLGAEFDLGEATAMVVTAVVASNQATRLQGGYKRFDIRHEDGWASFTPSRVLTRQITSPWRRRGLMKVLDTEGEL
ncbi:cardiolipin synthetase [Oceanicola granulosus HTCC2516]|uniref:Cardiolipin synthetase n=1 Tax=Oceanicola granulosus (strain ATCC BAA-861 / DSM 15982 / KCTC 12143 / HTCC2516) TaxID=314256 RepID=Q2CB84_OCEGH|nr:hypothetical protein [Oceanicola granulosus]EAR49955.1 cardiolipin synthetase [Oceanicola granulosus HTCC2516]